MKPWLIGSRHSARTPPDRPPSPELRAAYERGRRDERARRRKHSHPMVGLVVAASALVGAAALALAALQGSFKDGGEVMDRQIAAAAGQAEPVLRNAAGEAGEAIRDAGAGLSPDTAAGMSGG